jgi:hypothetical protein
VNEPPVIHETPAKLVPVEVLPPGSPPLATHGQTTGGPPIHAAAALLLLVVDNLWNLADWMVIDWIITIPLSFLSVAVPTFFIQKLLKKDSVGRALGFAALLGVIAAVPFSVTGSTVGVALLAWLGINKLLGKPGPR